MHKWGVKKKTNFLLSFTSSFLWFTEKLLRETLYLLCNTTSMAATGSACRPQTPCLPLPPPKKKTSLTLIWDSWNGNSLHEIKSQKTYRLHSCPFLNIKINFTWNRKVKVTVLQLWVLIFIKPKYKHWFC